MIEPQNQRRNDGRAYEKFKPKHFVIALVVSISGSRERRLDIHPLAALLKMPSLEAGASGPAGDHQDELSATKCARRCGGIAGSDRRRTGTPTKRGGDLH
jgi:hypothetical protein